MWVEISEKKKTSIFSSLRSCYHKLTNRKNLVLPLEKYFKTLNDMIKVWVFDATRSIFRYQVTTDIGFTDEVIVQYYVPVVKILL